MGSSLATPLYLIHDLLSLFFDAVEALVELLFELVFSLLNKPLLLIEQISLMLYLVLLRSLFGLPLVFDLLPHSDDLLLVLFLLVLHVILHLRQLILKGTLHLRQSCWISCATVLW